MGKRKRNWKWDHGVIGTVLEYYSETFICAASHCKPYNLLHIHSITLIPYTYVTPDVSIRGMKVCNHCRKEKAISHFINKRKTGYCVLCDKCRQAQELYTQRTHYCFISLVGKRQKEMKKRAVAQLDSNPLSESSDLTPSSPSILSSQDSDPLSPSTRASTITFHSLFPCQSGSWWITAFPLSVMLPLVLPSSSITGPLIHSEHLTDPLSSHTS